MHLYLIFCKQLDFQYRVNICPFGNIFLQTSSFSWIVLHIIELVGVYCIFSLCLRSIHPLRSNSIQWITNKKQLSWYLVVLKRHFRCVTTKVKVCKQKKVKLIKIASQTCSSCPPWWRGWGCPVWRWHQGWARLSSTGRSRNRTRPTVRPEWVARASWWVRLWICVYVQCTYASARLEISWHCC